MKPKLSCNKAKEGRPGYGEENIYGGLGGVYLERGDFEKSYYYYKKSMQATEDGLDDDEKFNFVVASLNTGRKVSSQLTDFVLGLKPGKFGKESRHL